MTIKMEENNTKNYLKRTRNNKIKPYLIKYNRQSNTGKHIVSEFNKIDKTDKDYAKFRIRIKKSQQRINSYERFRIKIPNLHKIKSEFQFFSVRIKESVEHREDSKNHFVDDTNDSELNSHGFIIQNSILKQKVINEMKMNKFREFLKFRNSLFNTKSIKDKKNISYCSLLELIELLFQKNMISLSVYNRFLNHYSHHLENNILENIEDSINKINFKGCLFFLIDHRILTKLLTHRFPMEYQSVTEATTFSQSANQYLEEIYGLQEQQYFNKLIEFNQKHQRFWMPAPQQILETDQLILNFEDGIEEIENMNKRGRILRKRC